MHGSAIKKERNVLKEQDENTDQTEMEKIGTVKVNFNPADYKVEQILGDGKIQLDNLVKKIQTELQTKKNRIPLIKLIAGESQIKNPSNFPNKGDLARARQNTIEKYLTQKGIKDVKFRTDLKIGETPYSGAEDLKDPEKMKKYVDEQFFSVIAYLIPTTEISILKFYIYKLTDGNEKQYAGIKYSTFKGVKSSFELIDEKTFNYLSKNLENTKLYKPSQIWQIVSPLLDKTLSQQPFDTETTMGLKSLSADTGKQNGYYQIVFGEGTRQSIQSLNTDAIYMNPTTEELKSMVVSTL